MTCPLDSARESRIKENVYNEGKLNQRCKYVGRKEMEKGHEYDVRADKIGGAMGAWEKDGRFIFERWTGRYDSAHSVVVSRQHPG